MSTPLNEQLQTLITLFSSWLKQAYAVEIDGAFLSYPEINNRARIVDTSSVVALFFDPGNNESKSVTVENLRNAQYVGGDFQLPHLKIKRLFGNN